MTMPANGTPGTDPADDKTGETNPDGTPKTDEVNETPEEKLARVEAENASLKANSRKWEDRAKANKAKADEFDKLQQSSATDAEKLSAALKAKEDAEARLVRYEVAAKTGLPSDLVEFLTATDEDALEEQAKKLLALRPATTTPPKPKPKADPSQGGGGGTDSKVSAADEGKAEAQRRIAARQKKS